MIAYHVLSFGHCESVTAITRSRSTQTAPKVSIAGVPQHERHNFIPERYRYSMESFFFNLNLQYLYSLVIIKTELTVLCFS